MAKLGLVKFLSGLEDTSEDQDIERGNHETIKTKNGAYIKYYSRYLNK